MTSPSILHLPTAVGGNAYGLSRGERALGLTSDVLLASVNPLSYPADIVTRLQPGSTARARAQRMGALLKTFFAVRRRYNVFHFNFGSSLLHFPGRGLPLLDIPFYPQDAKLIFTYNGCDARQKYPTMQRCNVSACRHDDCNGGLCLDPREDKARAASIAKMDRYAHAIFAVNPDLLHFLPTRARFLPYTVASWDTAPPRPAPDRHPPLRLAHAPTDRACKGSDAVFAAVAALQKEYGPHSVELDCIEGLPHREALQRYCRCHLLIDQLRVGWYGGVAVEAMRMGIPVAVYLREEDFVFVPDGMAKDCRSAFIRTDENTLAETLRPFVEDPGLLSPFREAALDYVHRWHDPVRVAEQVLQAYQS
jgi:hypothetical protein